MTSSQLDSVIVADASEWMAAVGLVSTLAQPQPSFGTNGNIA